MTTDAFDPAHDRRNVQYWTRAFSNLTGFNSSPLRAGLTGGALGLGLGLLAKPIASRLNPEVNAGRLPWLLGALGAGGLGYASYALRGSRPEPAARPTPSIWQKHSHYEKREPGGRMPMAETREEVLEKIAALAVDEEEAFRAGYLAKLASAGVTPEQVESFLEESRGGAKTAGIVEMLENAVSRLPGGLASLSGTGLAAAAALPIGVGALAGWGLADMGKPTGTDVKMMETEALADTYDYHRRRLLGENKLYQKKKKQMEREGGRSVGLV